MPDTTTISLLVGIFAILISFYTAKNSATKQVVDSLKTLVDTLEHRLEEESKQVEQLRQRVEYYKRFIELLLDTLRKNNIEPPDMPDFRIRTFE